MNLQPQKQALLGAWRHLSQQVAFIHVEFNERGAISDLSQARIKEALGNVRLNLQVLGALIKGLTDKEVHDE